MTMIFLRGHYTIDIVTGIMAGHYFFMLSQKYVWIIDYCIFKQQEANPNKNQQLRDYVLNSETKVPLISKSD
jgi:hypothetical protein